MEKLSGPPIPATKIFQCGEGARYFGRALRCKPERLRVRCSLAPKRTIAQTQIASRLFPLERNSGMVQCRDTSRQEAEMKLRSPDRFSSRSEFVRRESQPVGGSRRGGRCRKHQLHSKLCRRNKLSAHSDVGRGEGQGYFAYGAGDVGSNPTRFARVGS